MEFENIFNSLFSNKFCAFFDVENTETKHGHVFLKYCMKFEEFLPTKIMVLVRENRKL